MQATQSNNAVDLNKSDLNKSDLIASHLPIPRDSSSGSPGFSSPWTRDLSSPFNVPIFLGPIQAARKYLERQRGGVAAAAGGRTETAAVVEAVQVKPAPRQSNPVEPSAIQSSRNQSSREQDLRLERSLYEGHSIEAGLGFDDDGLDGLPGNLLASLSDSDGSEPVFPYAAPQSAGWAAGYPAAVLAADIIPDSKAVRGVIYRLACQAGVGQKSAPEIPEAVGSPIPVFADVARRMWLEDFDAEDERQILDTGAAVLSRREDPGATIPEHFANGLGKKGENAIQDRAVIAAGTSPLSGTVSDANAQLAESLHAAMSADVVADSLLAPSQGRETSVAADAALAHDACNLLSALLLYSNLLNLPGVLAEEHRHCAEGLKLIAERSRVLIDRLLQRDASVNAEAASPTRIGEYAKPATASLAAKMDGIVLLTDDASLQPAASASILESANRANKPERDEPVADHLPAFSSRMADSVAPEEQSLTCVPVSTESVLSVPVSIVAAVGSDVSTKLTSIPVSSSVDGAERGEAGIIENAAIERLAAQPASTNLASLLMRWGSLLSTLAHGTLEVRLGPQADTPVPLAAEPLERILVNLVCNARAATIAGGAVRIGVGTYAGSRMKPAKSGYDTGACGHDLTADTGSEDALGEAFAKCNATSPSPLAGRSIVLTVDDSGCGMDEAQVQRILGAESGFRATATSGAPEQSLDSLRAGSAACDPVKETVSSGYGRWPVTGVNSGEDTIGDRGVTPRVVQGTVAEDTPIELVTCEAQSCDPGDGGRRGLGLQVVKELVDLSGGRLAIHSILGRGTRIEIRWPVQDRASAEIIPSGTDLFDSADMAAVEVSCISSNQASVEAALQAELAAVPNSLPLVPRVALTVGALNITSPNVADQSSARAPQAFIGPDGFSEVELRAMMLRLNRSDPLLDAGSRERVVHGRNILAHFPDRGGISLSSPERPLNLGGPEHGRLAEINYSTGKGAIAC